MVSYTVDTAASVLKWFFFDILLRGLDLFVQESVMIANFLAHYILLAADLTVRAVTATLDTLLVVLCYVWEYTCAAASAIGCTAVAGWVFVVDTVHACVTAVVLPVFAFISRVIHAVTNHLVWIATVSANALVALAQMGWIWIKVRVLKGYHFFKGPIVRMARWTKAVAIGSWRLTKSIVLRAWTTTRALITAVKLSVTSFITRIISVMRTVKGAWLTVSRAAKEATLNAMRATKSAVDRAVVAPLKAVVASVVARYKLVKGMVSETFNYVKTRARESWNQASQRALAAWRNTTAHVRLVMGYFKQKFVYTKEKALAGFRAAKASVQQVRARIQNEMRTRWTQAKLQFVLYMALAKARFTDLKQRARATWRHTKARFVRSHIKAE